jgi:hypothetical protein
MPFFPPCGQQADDSLIHFRLFLTDHTEVDNVSERDRVCGKKPEMPDFQSFFAQTWVKIGGYVAFGATGRKKFNNG